MNAAVQSEKNYAAWSAGEVVAFYARERSRVEELYASERSLLPVILERCGTVLDVGCAAGGFMNILLSLKPGLQYTGVDVSREMVEAAARRFPQGRFQVSDGASLPFEESSFDLVLSTGVLHHNPNYLGMLREMYRVARQGCLWDLPRMAASLHGPDSTQGYMTLREKPGSRVPYILVSPRALFDFLLHGLQPKPSLIAASGYTGTPTASAVLPVKQVCFCVAYIGKGSRPSGKGKLLLDLPEEIASQIHPNDGAGLEMLREETLRASLRESG